MKVTTGPMLLLLTVGGLIVYLGQKYFEGDTAFQSSPLYAEAAAPQPAPCTADDTALALREATVAAAEARQAAQSAEIDHQLGEIAQRETHLDARQAGIEAREAELAQEEQRQDERNDRLTQWESALKTERAELDEGWVQFHQLLWVLYGLIAATGATLLALVWLAHRLIRASRRSERRTGQCRPAKEHH